MRNKQKGFTLVELMTVLVFLVFVVIGGGLLYTAFHFITKFW